MKPAARTALIVVAAAAAAAAVYMVVAATTKTAPAQAPATAGTEPGKTESQPVRDPMGPVVGGKKPGSK